MDNPDITPFWDSFRVGGDSRVALENYTCSMESIKIVLGCVLAAVLYGIIHDQFTARICVEYFTIFHPPIFTTQSPTLLGIGWGIVATWWAGSIVGLMLLIAARFGSRPQLPASAIMPLVFRLMGVMAICALVFGAIGYFWAPIPRDAQVALPPELHRRFLADWWAHSASYGSGFLGGLVLCVIVWVKRSGPTYKDTKHV